MKLGIDLGTANVLVYANGKIQLKEPSVVAIDKNTNSIKAVGNEARQMIGKTPSNIVAIRPLKDGVIADYEVTKQMLTYFINRVVPSNLFYKVFKPVIDVTIGVPAEITGVERKAVRDAAIAAGARKVQLIEQPMAAAIGAGLRVQDPIGNMVVDIGGGTTDIAVISLGGLTVSRSIRVAGNKMDEAIAKYIKQNYNLMIGDRTAEDIKIKIGSAYILEEEVQTTIKGRDLIEGLPKSIDINSIEIRQALAEPVLAIVEAVKYVLEQTPPELASDIIEQGIVLTGGGALLKGLDNLLQQQTNIPVRVAEDPLSCVAIGTGKAAEFLEKLV